MIYLSFHLGIQAEQSSDDDSDTETNSNEEPESVRPGSETPDCSSGAQNLRAVAGSETREDAVPEEVNSSDEEAEHAEVEAEVSKKVVVKISLNKLSSKLISQLRGEKSNKEIEEAGQSPIRTRSHTRSQTKSKLATESQENWIPGPARTARGRPLVRRFSRVSTSSSIASSSSMSSMSSRSRSSSSSSSSRSRSNSSQSSRGSSCGSVSSRHSSGARVWSPTESTTNKPPSIKSNRSNSKVDTVSEHSLNLALSESSDNEGSIHEQIQKIIDDAEDDEVFVNPEPVAINTVASKSSTVLNTPIHVPATPGRDWTSDGTFCPAPERQQPLHKSNSNNIELTNLSNTSLTARTEVPQPTPFQTPPPSVSYSSSAPTPEHTQVTCMTPSDSEVASPIQPPDLFKDDEARAPMVINDDFRTLDKSVVKDWLGQRAVLKVPESNHKNWSDDEGDNDKEGSDWSDAAWSEDDEPKPQSFSQLFNSTRAYMTPRMTPQMTPQTTNRSILPPMTPRSQEISQILDSLAYSPGMTV